MLDNQLTPCVEGHLHVGVPLCASVAVERTFCDEKVRQHRAFCCMVQGICSATQGINQITARKLGICMYGCEIWGISDQHMSLFQRAHELSKLTSQLRNVAELIKFSFLSH